MTQRLPLFPLGTVLFPGVLLPLHVFEDRYRALVRDLIAGPEAERAFGVVAIREGREVGADGVHALYDVGCLAQLHQVEAYDDGRFDLVTAGSRRFRVESLLDPQDHRPYLQAEVEFLDEPVGAGSDSLARGVGTVFRAYRSVLTGGGGAQAGEDLPEDPTMLSYLVAAASVLDRSDKQALLAQPDTASRLRYELAILRRETTLLRLLPSVPAVELTRTAVSHN
ncbi:MAG: uncharacterized protein QOI54_1322 [Actinomycetota bacterium]|nr:uncharacterized protein [Actinomycetota bacterium]